METFAPVLTLREKAPSRLLLVCDHARNDLPEGYDNLGLSDVELERHIAYDIGAEPLTRMLAARLDVTAIFGCYSRLLIDPNRGEDDPTLIVSVSDGTVIPGNVSIDGEERERRLDRFYRPYHLAITDLIDERLAGGRPPLIVSVHSFTPHWNDWPRPWHVGVLWDKDPQTARRLIDGLQADPALVVGDNEPYSGAAPLNSTLNTHAALRKLPHVLIEVRQELIASQSGVEAWADRLTPILFDLSQEG
ncbi:MAG: N-formylglutamate amidohydrolase [Alphaproteobacteria bacterium]